MDQLAIKEVPYQLKLFHKQQSNNLATCNTMEIPLRIFAI